MKTIKYLLILLTLASALWGCKNELEEKVYDFYSPNNLYKTQEDAESAITGMYGYLHSWNFFKAPYLFGEDVDHDHVVGPQWIMSDMGAGNFNNYWGTSALWVGWYSLVSQSNITLEKVPGIKMASDSVKNRILGEAYFFRAWSYYNLTRLWGPVPLRLENVSSGAPIDLARAPVTEVYNQVIADLQKAEQLLPLRFSPNAGAAGKVNRGAAKTLLAKTYATMASSALNAEQLTVRGKTYTKDVVKGYESLDSKALYTKARDKALEVIQGGEFNLMPTFMQVWGRANKNNPEMIWELQTQDNDTYGTLLQYYYSAPWYGGTSYQWMSAKLYDSYTAKDTRAVDGVFHQYYMYGAWMLYPERDTTLYKSVSGGFTAKFYPAYSHPFTKKYWLGASTEIGATGTTVRAGNRDCDFPLLRYADLLLIYAEAENEINGPTQAAYAQLNKIRERSKLAAASGLNKQEFRSLVFEERGKELYQEVNRRHDLIRWGVYLQVMNDLGTDENVIKTRSDKNLLFPIPQDEINSNKLIGVNNPGW
ncbi:RagB/SusD family nutrient uptake outer membrane protein [Dyadobacter frigoris]|uniref:RagB/SusD family nutrient uptake outer membrane protein n=1 Tax=Dyadobacter frigoris TaxID=2576211 RepID=A0A4U6D7K4_9BACT|nr:RagB/SusD family nutrient uptake outer membrane protein [Dyadobacter frigoris]TKT92207.1 RagB/SusD family nutrient uptake outer membrane protein [Dyadobacter frigoris]GLU53378.1 membrane protein [Dyadobacter frigoris]